MPGANSSRTPHARLAKRDATYTVDEIAELFTVHPNTVRNWMASGLKAIDGRRPILIHGSDLIAFLNYQKKRRKRCCGPDELFCFKCREPRLPKDGVITHEIQNPRVMRAAGHCTVCGTRMFKAVSRRHEALHAESAALQPAPAEHITACADAAVNCDLETEETP